MSTDEPPTGDEDDRDVVDMDMIRCRALAIVDGSGAPRIVLSAAAGSGAGIVVTHPSDEKLYTWLGAGHGAENEDDVNGDTPTSDLHFYDPAFGYVSVVETMAKALHHIEKHHELLEAMAKRIELLEEIIANAKPLGGNPN